MVRSWGQKFGGGAQLYPGRARLNLPPHQNTRPAGQTLRTSDPGPPTARLDNPIYKSWSSGDAATNNTLVSS